MQLTEEQKDIIERFSGGSNMAIEALAGAGKTTILVELGKKLAEIKPASTAYYITFNRKNADEVQGKFNSAYPEDNAYAVTVHALALRALSATQEYSFVRSKLNKNYPPKYVSVGRFVSEEVQYTDKDGNIHRATPTETYNIALETIRHFCMSADENISPKHIPELWKIKEKERSTYVNIIVPMARAMWEDITSPDGNVFFLHDYYLKMWSLSKPEIGSPGDVILYDEAQDARDCVTSVVFNQEYRQIVVVGDHYQNIYSFMGSSNALRKMVQRPGVERGTLTTSWRFGENVAKAGTSVLRYIGCDSLTLHGNPSRDSKALAYKGKIPSDTNTIIARSNGEVIRLMMELIEEGKRVHAVLNTWEIFNACDDIERMRSGLKAQKIPELKQLKNYQELVSIVEEKNNVSLGGVSLYRVIIRMTPEHVRSTVEQGVSENKADIIVSTMHKAKGMEWPKVAIVWDEERRNIPDRTPDVERHREDWGDYFSGNKLSELMLLYVAITRAQDTIYVPSEIARRCGIVVGNAEDFELEWSGLDFVDWCSTQKDVRPFRMGSRVDVPEKWDVLYPQVYQHLDHNTIKSAYAIREEVQVVMYSLGIKIPPLVEYRDINSIHNVAFTKDYGEGEYGYKDGYFNDESLSMALESAVAEISATM